MHWCLEDVQQVHGDAGLSKNGGQVIYPDANPRGTKSSEPAPPKPVRSDKTKSDEPTAPGLEAIPPTLPLPEPIPAPQPKANGGSLPSVPSESSARTPPASSQWPPANAVVPAGYPSETSRPEMNRVLPRANME